VIVVDTNVIVYLVIEGEYTPLAERILERDPDWRAPVLWRSEFRNTLVLYMRRGLLSLDQSNRKMQSAGMLMEEREHEVLSSQVLSLASSSRCSAYDCEFVGLAISLGVPLVTADGRILSSFPLTAISIEDFAGDGALGNR